MVEKLKHLSLISFCMLFLIGCLVSPKVDKENDLPPDCKLITRKLKLKVTVIDPNVLSNCNQPECIPLALAPVVVTGVVSSTVMILNNTIHWIEKEGTCDEGSIKKAIDSLTSAIVKSGGWFVDSVDVMLNWLKSNGDKKEKEKVEKDKTVTTQ